jgi:hypothetical protein
LLLMLDQIFNAILYLPGLSTFFMNNSGHAPASTRVNPEESHPEQRGHGSPRESRGERCEDRKGFPRGGKSLSFVGTYTCQCFTDLVKV